MAMVLIINKLITTISEMLGIFC